MNTKNAPLDPEGKGDSPERMASNMEAPESGHACGLSGSEAEHLPAGPAFDSMGEEIHCNEGAADAEAGRSGVVDTATPHPTPPFFTSTLPAPGQPPRIPDSGSAHTDNSEGSPATGEERHGAKDASSANGIAAPSCSYPLGTGISGTESTLGSLRINPDTKPVWAGENPAGTKLFLWFFLALLLFSLYLMYNLVEPFLNTIIVAFIFSAICYPFYRRCLKLVGGKQMLAALMVLICLMFLAVLPITIFIAGLIPQASESIAVVNNWLQATDIADILDVHIAPLTLWLEEHFPGIDLGALDIKSNIVAFSSRAGQYLLSSGTQLLGNTVMVVTHLFLMFLIMFFTLIDGHRWLERLEYLLPLKPEQTTIVVESLRRMSKAVLVGGFCVAALQGLVGGIGLAIVGIPALFWGTVMAFAALVPVVGTGLVWVPTVVMLLVTGSWKAALFLSIWCGIGVTSIDSVLRPLLMRDGAQVPVLFIFLSILGGVMTFGMLGLLYGPVILGLVVVMIDIYSQEYKSILENRTFIKKG